MSIAQQHHLRNCLVVLAALSAAFAVLIATYQYTDSDSEDGCQWDDELELNAEAAEALTQMQGLIKTLEESINASTADNTRVRMLQAQKKVQEIDDGLTDDEKVALITLFIEDSAAASTYLALTNAEFRKDWVRIKLSDVN